MTAILTRGSLLDDIFRDFSPSYFVKPLHGNPLPNAGQIKVDVKESEGQYLVLADLPGVAKENIHVSVDGGVVTLKADVKQQDQHTDGAKVLRSERYYGAVSRSFQLPDEVDSGAAKAKYDNGVLTLTLPKKVTPSAQRLAIE